MRARAAWAALISIVAVDAVIAVAKPSPLHFSESVVTMLRKAGIRRGPPLFRAQIFLRGTGVHGHREYMEGWSDRLRAERPLGDGAARLALGRASAGVVLYAARAASPPGLPHSVYA